MKYGLLKLNRKDSSVSIVAAAISLFSFTLAFISGSFFLQSQASKAVAGLELATAPTISLTKDASTIELSPTPGINEGLAAASHTLTASTNVPTGYNLSLSAESNPALSPTTGTILDPTILQNSTWGFALASTSMVGALNDFDASYAAPTPGSASRWANPTTPTTIKNTQNTTSSDTTAVYYGAKVDMSLPSGTYENTVHYTATTNISDIPAPSIISVTPNTGTTAGGTAITIIGTGFTVKDQSVTTSVILDNLACTNVRLSSNTPTTGQDTITCNTPAHASGEGVNLAVTTWSKTATLANGYAYITPPIVTFVSPNQASTIPGTESGPAFTIAGANFTGTTQVTIGGTVCANFQIISDTHIFCKAPNTINTSGNKKIEVIKSDAVSAEDIIVTYTDTNHPTFESSNAYANCPTTAKLYRDTRDSQLYYVKKMVDNKCWMVDNLKYANYGSLSQGTGNYLTVDGTDIQSTANSDIAKYIDPGATDYCKGSTDIPINTNTRCGLLYNWYAATNGSGTYAQSTRGTNVTGSICPANFRLPSIWSSGATATGSGASYNAADFAVLSSSMNAGTLMYSDNGGSFMNNNYPANWQPTGAWGGIFSGIRQDNLNEIGFGGYFWSSSVESAPIVANFGFSSTSALPAAFSNKRNGLAVRCVMEDPSNYSSTNPAVLDVYPTTGWRGDIVTITSNALFTNVTNVTIGDATCEDWGVVNSSAIKCRLPFNIYQTAGLADAGATYDITVINNGTNIAPASTYKHMKITYFDPRSSTVSVGGTVYNLYANGFTSADCSTLTPNNSPINQTPPSSMAYFRDTRNNQTYKVKKMADGKCWMVDNLKYISATSPINADGTTGMAFNNGDHLNNGGTGAYNTVGESSTQSVANSDKRFYNNPMGNSYCYGTTNMPTNSLTRCGYLYNWYAATNGTGTYAQNTEGTNVTGNICPANFRLPSVTSNGSTATSDGTSHNAADFAVLNASMDAGALVAGSTSNYYANWRPNGAWGGVFSGSWGNNLSRIGEYGYFWSSTVDSAGYAHDLSFISSYVLPDAYGVSSLVGYAVRCVLD